MALPMREAHDLVFQRRAIPRADAGDLAVEERGLGDVLADQVVDAVVRVEHVTAICGRSMELGRERERDRRIVAAL